MSEYSTYVRDLDEQLWSNFSVNECWKAIDNYFDYNDIETGHEYLWKMTVGLLTNDELDATTNGRERLNAIHFFECTKFVLVVLNVLRTLKGRNPPGTNKKKKKKKK